MSDKKPKLGVWYKMGKDGNWEEVVPKPVNTQKWKLDEIRNVWLYQKDGNWAEVDAREHDDIIPTRLFIKGELREFIDQGWCDLEDSMGYCEWQIEHPDGPKLGWFGTTWRLCVLALLLFVCLLWPLYSFVGYCALSYIVMAYMLLSGQLSQPGSIFQRIINGFILWLFSPLYFPLLILISAIRPPIL